MDRQRRASFNRLKKKMGARQAAPPAAAPGPSGPNAEMWDVFYAFELKRNEVAMAGLKAQRDFLSHERTRLGEIVRHARGLLQGKRI